MRYLQCICLSAAVFVIGLSQLLALENTIQINESEMQATILEKEIKITTTVWNHSGKPVSGVMRIELLDPSDIIGAFSESVTQLKPGKSPITVKLSQPLTSSGGKDTLLWHRVRYSFKEDNGTVARGIAALGAITPEMFELRIAHAKNALPGKPYRVRIHAANPVTRRPVSGVLVRGEMELDSSNSSVSVTRSTNASGDALLLFQMPRDLDEGGNIKIEARNGGQIQKEGFDFELDPRIQIIINTDKLLYQPGQPLHARALVLGADKHAVADEGIEFKLQDPENKTILSSASKTNDFGVASIDWDLPGAIELGSYELRVSLSDRGRYRAQEETNIRISRYDLPNFTVTAKPDRAYYLPDQNASIEISAKYLFGKELTGGSVKLMRQEQGRWDYKTHKWVVDEAEEKAAKLDKSGRSVFMVDLSEFHSNLFNEKYRRFLDLNYAAYVTDPTSGKTEQRRFTVRVSRHPIHVYISGASFIEDRTFFYISTYYPDGKPAECQVGISEDPNYDGSNNHSEKTISRQLLHKIKTNPFGVAKISDLQLLNLSSSHQLIFDVRDRKGAGVPYEEIFWRDSGRSIQVMTDKVLYKGNEQILVTVRAPIALSGHIAIDLSKNGAVLWTGRIRIRNHQGFTVIPYLPEFKGELAITAYSLEADVKSQYYVPRGARKILFPNPSTLKIKIDTDRSSYKPGEEAAARINVSLPSGASSASALGAVVVDKAVEERIRTDQEFSSGHFGFWDWSWWYPMGSVGGITLKDLNELDLSKPLPEGMDLAAEMLLQYGYDMPEIEGYDYQDLTRSLFFKKMENQLYIVRRAVQDKDSEDFKFPTNSDELKEALRKMEANLNDLVDPWGSPYRYVFGVEYRNRYIDTTSAGPDKQFDTADDIAPLRLRSEYFKLYGKIIDRAVKETVASSGLYVKDFNALNSALILRGLDLNTLLDPWGNLYKLTFDFNGPACQINVFSSGKHGNIAVWTSSIDYFELTRKSIDDALVKHFWSAGLFPRDDMSFDNAMAVGGIQFRGLVDPWGRPYYLRFSYESEYGDKEQFVYKPNAQIQTVAPITRKLAWIRIYSSGPDGQPRTDDDFRVSGFSQDISEQSGKDLAPRLVSSAPLSESSGAIDGVITDQSGGVLPGVKVIASLRQTRQEFTAISSSNGYYIVRNIPGGIYDISFSLPGFRTSLVRDVPVHATSITTVNVELSIGTISQTVEITVKADDLMLESSSSIASVKSMEGTKAQIHEETFTPRLRDYFPETLFWAPSIITDSSGHARVKIKLADNITTWKMTVLASTKSGEIGVAEKEIEAFQPFFLEHDPPKILTVGDAVDLPVIVRNYLPQDQKLNIEMKPAPWFDLQNPGKQQVSVAAGEAKSAFFPFRATAMVKSGKQQVSAANRSTGDAIEKTIRVHPDGLEQSSSAAGMLSGDNTLALKVPDDFIPGSLNARLKIYPNLIAHVVESIEAGLERPYGCGEQTISSTYPSVLLLMYYKASGKANSMLQNKAMRYLKLGYQRLLNYREQGGGFSYWGRSSPDVALTAYALRFLHNASSFIAVDPGIIQDAGKWLASQQGQDGSWRPGYGYEDNSLTAYIAAMLAQAEKHAGDQSKNVLHESVKRALTFLSDPRQVVEEPYALAEFALAAAESGDKQAAAAALDKLRKHAAPERGGFYWALNRNTPFYGWGRTGRIESTAMVVLALSKSDSISPETRRLIDGGTLWLLQQKDRYGVWHSGQATVAVLFAMLSRIESSGAGTPDAQVTITVNGRPVEMKSFPAQSDAPVIMDISGFVKPGDNNITIKSAGMLPSASAQAVADYYIPWTGESAREAVRPGDSEALRLGVKFDKTEANAGDEIHCKVEAERIGSRGWGMMIAEVGLPPGADVDRRTLDEETTAPRWTVSRYDVLPDRLVLYLWPQAGGVKVNFSFRPRYGLKARSAPSTLYDYYNPDANVSLPPADFVIQRRP